MVVPGGRFRESYYWDSYFTILGLLSCNMPNTTRNVIDNLLDDVANFGFVPNGGRIYYLDRSQPPLLSDMVVKYYDFMMASSSIGGGNTGMETVLYLNSSFFLLITEYNWWMNPKNGHVVSITDPVDSSKSYILNRYFSNVTTPRPESFYVDYYNGYFNGRFPDTNTNSEEFHFDDDSYDSHPETSSPFFHSIRAAAESGWDFSRYVYWFNVANAILSISHFIYLFICFSWCILYLYKVNKHISSYSMIDCHTNIRHLSLLPSLFLFLSSMQPMDQFPLCFRRRSRKHFRVI